MTTPYDLDGKLLPGELIYAEAIGETVDYPDAGSGDLIACYLGSIESGVFNRAGSFDMKLSIPFDIIGNPTEIMRSQGEMVVVKMFKVMPRV